MSKIEQAIKALGETNWGKDNEAQGKAVQLLRGIAFSDEPISNTFMTKLSDATTKIAKECLEEAKVKEEDLEFETRLASIMEEDKSVLEEGKSPNKEFSKEELKQLDLKRHEINSKDFEVVDSGAVNMGSQSDGLWVHLQEKNVNENPMQAIVWYSNGDSMAVGTESNSKDINNAIKDLKNTISKKSLKELKSWSTTIEEDASKKDNDDENKKPEDMKGKGDDTMEEDKEFGEWGGLEDSVDHLLG